MSGFNKVLMLWIASFRRKYIVFIIGLIISSYFIYILYNDISKKTILEYIKILDIKMIFTGILLMMSAHITRAYRWYYLLSTYNNKSIKYLQAINYLNGNALNTFLPLRLGDIFRLFITFKILSNKKGLILFISEKLIDLIITGQMFLLGVLILFQFENKLFNVVIALLLIVSFLSFYIFTNRINKITFLNRQFPKIKEYIPINNFLIFNNIKFILFLSYLSWILEIFAFQQITLSLGIDFGFFSSLLLSAGGALSTVIPSLPSNIGTFHFVISEITKILGASAETGVSFSIIIHSIIMGTVQILGFLSLIILIYFKFKK